VSKRSRKIRHPRRSLLSSIALMLQFAWARSQVKAGWLQAAPATFMCDREGLLEMMSKTIGVKEGTSRSIGLQLLFDPAYLVRLSRQPSSHSLVVGKARFPDALGKVEVAVEACGAAERSQCASTQQRRNCIRVLKERAVPPHSLGGVTEDPKLFQSDEQFQSEFDLPGLQRPGEGCSQVRRLGNDDLRTLLGRDVRVESSAEGEREVIGGMPRAQLENLAQFETSPHFDAQERAVLRYAKEAVVNGLELPLADGLRLEGDLSTLLRTTEDRVEGAKAFLEKRAPRWTGK